MKDIFNGTNIPALSVREAVDRLAEAYVTAINKGLGVFSLPAFMLWGSPGIGKSNLTYQVAEKIEQLTGKRVVVTDVRLLLFNPIDLRGIPTANEDRTLAVWLRPKIFQMDDSKNVINILLLDELTACPPSVQAAAYQITLDRTVGEHKLPDNCIVIAAGNKTTDKSVSYKMPKALANRLCHIEIEANFASWTKWARSNNIHYKVIDFLSARRDYFMAFDASKDDLAFPTPRSWEMVSNVINIYNGDVDRAYPLIAGCIGSGVATEFRIWCKVYNQLPEVEDIFAGKRPQRPSEPDALFALVSVMLAYAREHSNDTQMIGNAIDYSEKLPPDFSVSFMKELINMEKDYRSFIIGLPAYRRWMDRKGRYFNGIE